MKLLKKTYLLASAWMIPALIIGSVFCYYTIRYIVYEEADEYLTYEMERLVRYHEQNGSLPDFHKVAGIVEGQSVGKPFFKDTLILEPGDNEMVPHRELVFSLRHNGKDFVIILRHLLPGKDDTLQGTLLITGGLMALISIILFLMINQVSERTWKPFHTTLKTLTRFKISDPVPAFPHTEIDEFNTLNTTARSLLQKISDDYRRTREFNENASHELQTHLAIIRANSEGLLDHAEGDASTMEKMRAITEATVRLSQAQKSLLLLSRIGNQEYSNPREIDLSELVRQSLGLFEEAIQLRNIAVRSSLAPCRVSIDPGLADILVNNLVKNAVKHNVENGEIVVTLTPTGLTLENTGLPYEGAPESLLERFRTGQNGGLGIGLAIVRQICELNGFQLAYDIAGDARHIVKIGFKD
ncbi:MAG: HAMP domain-containing sensor histidine kinase [Saprospiraceae bacterium]